MNNYQDYEVEREVDLIDLCFALLKKWKQIIIGAIVVCALICSYGFMKSKKDSVVSVTDPKEALTDNEIENVDNIYSSYEQTLNARDLILSKAQDSAIAQISTEEAVGRMISYIIESDIDNIYSYYRSINVFTKDEQEEIIKACNFVEDTNNLDDLITMSGTQSEYIAGLSSNTTMKTTMTISIYANSDEACDTIQAILEKHIDAKNSITNATCTKLEVVDDIETNYISESQTNFSTQLSDINNRINGFKNISYLSDDELTYYNSLINGEEEEEVTTVTTSFNLKKYGVVGVAGGLFVMCFFYAMIYVLSGKVHASDDFKAYGLDSLGKLDYSKDDVSKEMWLVSSIASFMKLHELKKLYIALDYKNEKIEKTLNTFVEELKKQDIDVISGDPLKEKDSFNELMASEAVVLFETAEQSKYESVSKIIDLANRQNISLVGSIVGKM